MGLPAFREYSHDFHQFITRDAFRSHNLRKFSDRVRNGSVVFREISDVILDSMTDFITSSDDDSLISLQFTDLNWWLNWTSIICSYLSFISVIYLFYKSRVVASALILLKSGAGAQPVGFPSFLSYGSTTKPSAEPS